MAGRCNNLKGAQTHCNCLLLFYRLEKTGQIRKSPCGSNITTRPSFSFPLVERRSKRVGCKTLSRVFNLRFIRVISAVCLSFSRQLCATARGERETLLRKQVRAPQA